MRISNSAVHINSSSLLPTIYEDRKYLYINGKKYNKDFTITDFDTIPFLLDKRYYENESMFSILTYNRYSNNIKQDGYNNRDIYPFTIGNMSIYCEKNGYYHLICSSTSNIFVIINYDTNGYFLKSHQVSITSDYGVLKNVHFLGQSSTHIYLVCITNKNGSSYIYSIPKSLSTSASLISSSGSTYSINIQKIFETESKIFTIRGVGHNGCSSIHIYTKNANSLHQEIIETKIKSKNNIGYIRFLNYPMYETNKKIYTFGLCVDLSIEDSFKIYYRVLDKDKISEDNISQVVVDEGYCSILNGDTFDIFKNYHKDILDKKIVVLNGQVIEFNGDYYIHLYTCIDGSSYSNSSNSIMTFKIIEFSQLEYIGQTMLPSTSHMPIVMSSKTFVVPTASSILFLHQDIMTKKYKIMYTVNIPFASITIDETDRIFAIDGNGNTHLLSDNTVYNIDVDFYAPSLEYADEDIDAYILVNAYNHSGSKISIDVSLEINGPGVFSRNNKKTITVKTSTHEDTKEYVKVNGSGVLQIDGSVLI